MKAIVCRNYGSPDVLECEELAKPNAGDDEVLIRVRAASVNPVDRVFRAPYMVRIVTGLRKPKEIRLGRDVAGQVEAVGRNVTQFKPGDEVFGVCLGAYAEFVCASASALVRKPDNVTFEQAAAVPIAALTALQGLRDKGRIQAGQKVLINGASGGVGTFAVQIARSFGADVTGVCSTRNVEMVRSIGADRVIDYTLADFTRSGQRYDMIFDVVANHSFSACQRVLSPRGTLVVAGGGGADGHALGRRLGRTLTGALISRFAGQRMTFFVARPNQGDLVTLGDLLESREVTPVLDGRHRLSETSEAFRRLAGGHARGKIVVTVAP